MGLIQLKEVTKRFGKNLVLDGVNLDIPENQIFGILGINGSGKTTVLRLIVNFYKPSKGEVLYDGKKVRWAKKRLKAEVGFTTQESSFYNKLTVEENVKYFGSLYGLPVPVIKRNLERILHLTGLEQVRHKVADQLSGGMQRRLDMACALIHVPKVVILDEPTEDLDPLLKKEILSLIKRIKEIGTTVIMTSHLLEDVEQVCDQVAIIHNHKVIRSCSIDELKKEYSTEDEIHMQTQQEDYETIMKNISSYEAYKIEGHKLIIKTKDAEKILHEILHIIENTGEKLLYIDMQKPSLTEVFESLTSDVPAQKGFLRREG